MLIFFRFEESVSFCISYKEDNELFLNNNFHFEIMEIINGNCDEDKTKEISSFSFFKFPYKKLLKDIIKN